ncbi:MAG: hypothetical protein J3K34DRAFT_422985 [Monoraphidium minutum]|nr:MAG: hypothetical protein J3K34DRAFT_422985 [Monoraphidium minutum]
MARCLVLCPALLLRLPGLALSLAFSRSLLVAFCSLSHGRIRPSGASPCRLLRTLFATAATLHFTARCVYSARGDSPPLLPWTRAGGITQRGTPSGRCTGRLGALALRACHEGGGTGPALGRRTNVQHCKCRRRHSIKQPTRQGTHSGVGPAALHIA